MKNHKWKNIGALQWGALGLEPSQAESYEQCELCGAKVAVRYNAGEGLTGAIERAGVPAECPNAVEEQIAVGAKKIFLFCNGGSPGWYNAMSICEDGHVLAGHACSDIGWCQHDLGIGSDWKHDKYKAHCPEGYELIWVENPKTHDGLQKAYVLNQALAAEKKKSELVDSEKLSEPAPVLDNYGG